MIDEPLKRSRVTIITWDDDGAPESIVDFPNAMGNCERCHVEGDVRRLLAPVTIEAPDIDRIRATVEGWPAAHDWPFPTMSPAEVVRFLLPTEGVRDSAEQFREVLDAKIAGQAEEDRRG